jgi:hypothetical protein
VRNQEEGEGEEGEEGEEAMASIRRQKKYEMRECARYLRGSDKDERGDRTGWKSAPKNQLAGSYGEGPINRYAEKDWQVNCRQKKKKKEKKKKKKKTKQKMEMEARKEKNGGDEENPRKTRRES